MVDAQFKDDQYVDSEERNREALAQARRAVESNAAVMKAPPKPKSQVLSERAAAMRAAAQKAINEDTVLLAELSKNTPNGEEIRVKVQRIAPQELIAGDFMPTRARMVVNKFISMGVEATEGERNRVGLKGGLTVADLKMDELLEETFGDDKIAAGDAYVGLINAVCIAAIRDPEMRLYWKRKDANEDIYGFCIEDIPWADREAVATWALTQEDKAAQSVEPFPSKPESGADNVSQMEEWTGEAKRADQV